MAYPTLHITNGPGQRDLEQAFLARNLGATARFTIFVDKHGPVTVELKIYNFSFVTCQGENYKLGGLLTKLQDAVRAKLPLHNFVFADYNTEKRTGMMEFTNGE